MLKEYAVEPESLSKLNTVWQAMEQFGVEHGRLISDFPKKWLRSIYDSTASCSPIERKSIEERLIRLKDKVVRFRKGSEFNPDKSWRENVYQEDSHQPFHAIIQTDNDTHRDRILTPFDLHEGTSLWKIRREYPASRKPGELAKIVAPLGLISRELLFIDPYLSTDPKWINVLVECLKACEVNENNHRRIEIHTQSTVSRAEWNRIANKQIAPSLPVGVSIRFVIWGQREEGEKFHARYFMTERGGIRFDVGLDAGKPGETTDVGLLSEALRATRWKQFQDSTAAFDKVDEFTITGTL